MKIITSTGLFLAASLTVHAQGKVSFGNDSNHYITLGGQPIQASLLPDGTTLIAALFAGNGTSGNNLTLATSYALDTAGWLTAGRMVTHGVILNGIIGGQVDTLAVVVSDVVGALGSAYPVTMPNGAHYFGTSGLFQMTPGTGITYPSIVTGGGSTWAPGNLEVYPWPEPSTITLVGVGAVLMVISRRRRASNPRALEARLLALSLTLACSAAFGQGKVSFGNDSNHYFVLGMTWPEDAALGGGVASIAGNTVSGCVGAIPMSPLPSGYTLIAALYAGNGTSGNNLTLATSYALDATGWLTAGRMVTHGIAVAGLTGGQVDTLAVVIGDRVGAIGSAYPALNDDAAALGYMYYGSSGLFQMTPGTSLTYPSIATGGGTTWAPSNLVLEGDVPEPSALALAGLGGALMYFRRRK